VKGKGYSFSAYPVDVVSFEDCGAKCAQIQKDCGKHRHPGEQRRHHARHDVQEDGQGGLGRGDAPPTWIPAST